MPRYEDEDTEYEERPRRSRPAPRNDENERERRESLIERRMRAARGEEYEYEDDDYSPRAAFPRSGYSPTYRQPTSSMATAFYALLGVLAVGVLAFMLGPRLLGSVIPDVDIPAAIQQVVATPTPTLIDRGGTIKQIRALDRLETQQISAERIIEAKNERGNILDAVTGDKLLLIASGTVIAGVDMAKLSDQSVTLSPDGNSITLNLPPTEIFVRTLDNERTRVYERTTGIFTKADPELETLARQSAEVEILNAACEADVMQKAADEAERSLTQFLTAVGFTSVTVNASAGPCTAAATVPVQ